MERLKQTTVIIMIAVSVCLILCYGQDWFYTARTYIQDKMETTSGLLEEKGLGQVREEYLKQEERSRHLSQNIVKNGS